MSPRRSCGSRRAAGLLAATGVAAGLGGCADYTQRTDTVTGRAGEAQAWNRVVQAVDPWPAYVMDTRLSGDGPRTQAVIGRYGAAAPETTPEITQAPTQTQQKSNQ